MKYGVEFVPLGKAGRDLGMKIRMQPASSLVVIEKEKRNPCGTGWLQLGLQRYHLTVDESFLIFPGPGQDLGTNVAADITWVILQQTGPARFPTMVAQGLTISEGFTFLTHPSTDGSYLNTSFALQAQLGGQNVCPPIYYESMPEMILSLHAATNVTLSLLDGGVYRWEYNHVYDFSCEIWAENLPPSHTATWHYSAVGRFGGDPNYTVTFTVLPPPDRLQIVATRKTGAGPYDQTIVHIWAEDSVDPNVTAPPWFFTPGDPDWRIIPEDFF